MAEADPPDGPWRALGRVLVDFGAEGEWDSNAIHDPCPLLSRGRAISDVYEVSVPAFKQGRRDIYREYADLARPPAIHPDPNRISVQAAAETRHIMQKPRDLEGMRYPSSPGFMNGCQVVNIEFCGAKIKFTWIRQPKNWILSAKNSILTT